MCDPRLSGNGALSLIERRKRRAFGGPLGALRRRTDPDRWRRIPLTRQELSFYGCHMSGGMRGRIAFNPELVEGTEIDRVVSCLMRYAQREAAERDGRPWWSKAESAAAWDGGT